MVDKPAGEGAVVEILRELARVLERARHGSDYARQKYIATHSPADRQRWAEALDDEHDAWDAYWSAHRGFFSGEARAVLSRPPGRRGVVSRPGSKQ